MVEKFTVEKKSGNLIFNDLGGYESRNPSTIWCIQQADKIYNWKNFKQITIHTGDYEHNNNDYTYSKKNNYNNLVPDFNFHSWPQVGINDYEQYVNEISAQGVIKYEINKVGWIGSTKTNEIRRKLFEIGNSNKDLFDIFDMSWISSNQTQLNSTKYISTPDLVKKYSALIDVEGYGYSGRVKHLLWSHRPLLLVERPHVEFFYKDLKAWRHYIPIKRDLSDLIDKTKWCLYNYEKAFKIAENAYEFSKKHLTRNACYSQWNNIIQNIQ